MQVLAQLGTFVAEARAADLPAHDLAVQRRHFVDTVIAGAVGSQAPAFKAMRPLWGDGAEERIALHAAAIRMTEIDDIETTSCTTPSSVTVPVALGVPGADGDLRDALYVGTDLLVRFGAAVNGPELLYRNIWPTYLAAPMAAAATAARMMRLDADKSAVALALGLVLSAGGSGRFAEIGSPRWLLHARAVENGVFAARAAAMGFGADLTLLDGEWLELTHGAVLDRERLLDGLGAQSVYPRLSIKPFASAKQAIAAVSAFIALMEQGIDPEAIISVHVHVPGSYAAMLERKPAKGARNYASVAYQCALAAYHRDSLHHSYGDLPLSPPMQALMDKVSVIPDPLLDQHYPQHWPARVVVEANGASREHTIIAAPGDPESSFADAELRVKAEKVLAAAGLALGDWWEPAGAALDDADAASRLVARIGQSLGGQA